MRIAAFCRNSASEQSSTFLHTEHRCDGAVVLAELCQQAGGDGEQVTSCQCFHLTGVPEGGAHHHSLVAILLVVVENIGHAQHTWGGTTKKISLLKKANRWVFPTANFMCFSISA